MKVIGLDPAHNKSKRKWSVYVLLDEGAPKEAGEIPQNDTREFYKILKAFSPDLAVCEDPYLGRSVTTLKALEFVKGRLAGVAELRGIPFYQAKPTEWKSHFRFLRIPPAAESTLKAGMFQGMNNELYRRLEKESKIGRLEDYLDALCIAIYGEACVRKLQAEPETPGADMGF